MTLTPGALWWARFRDWPTTPVTDNRRQGRDTMPELTDEEIARAHDLLRRHWHERTLEESDELARLFPGTWNLNYFATIDRDLRQQGLRLQIVREQSQFPAQETELSPETADRIAVKEPPKRVRHPGADRPNHPVSKFWIIVVNGNARRVPKEVLTYDEVVTLAGHPASDLATVTFRHAHADKPEGILGPGESVRIKEGAVFNINVTN